MQMGHGAGPDELIAELFRFVRPEDYSSRYGLRLTISVVSSAAPVPHFS